MPIPTAQLMSIAVTNPNPVQSSLAEGYLTAGSGFATDAQLVYISHFLSQAQLLIKHNINV